MSDVDPFGGKLFTKFPSDQQYPENEEYQSHLLDQYKLYVEMADRVSARRQTANSYFLSINTALLGFAGYVTTKGADDQVWMLGVVGQGIEAAATISSWGFPVSMEKMQALAAQMGEKTLFARTGGAPSLAVGMASIFGNAFGNGLLAIWYHFAIMFEAVFILTTLDAGTRVGRFMLQDLLGNLWKPMGRTSWYPSVLVTSAAIVASWGYFLYIGVIDPNGGVNLLWPLFGIANQMLAAIALSVATGILIKSGKLKYAWVSGIPLAWLAVITTSAAWEKITSPDIRIGFFSAADNLAEKLSLGKLPPEKAAIAPRLIFNMQLDGALTLFLVKSEICCKFAPSR